jgi:AcrR family transcriptional regulator
MAYRRTENIVRKLAARHDGILAAARMLAAEGGMAAVQINAVAARAGIAAGTVYRYFPSKTELVGAVIAALAEREIAAIRRAADAAPGPLSALAAAITCFAARALAARRLAFAILAEPVEPEIDSLRVAYRQALAVEFEGRILAAVQRRLLPDQDGSVAALALVGALIEGLIGPLAPESSDDRTENRKRVQALTLFALRALGVVDARARGLVVQTPTTLLPPD